MNLNDFRRKEFSQNSEDGVTEKIFELIGTTNKVAVEIGVGDGGECCSRIMWQNHGFSPILMDKDSEHTERKLTKHFITPCNVLEILEGRGAPLEPDFLGVDIDSYDFYVVHTILKKYRPRLLVVETNPTFLTDDKVIKLDYPIESFWAYHGAGLAAWKNSLNHLGYYLVCHEWSGINAFFVRGHEIEAQIDNFDSISLFSPHEADGKPGKLENYAMYPPHFPILTSKEALELLNGAK
jgi:hypothetical protein